MSPPAQSSSIMCLIVCDSTATDSSTSKVWPSLLMRVINLFSAVVDIALALFTMTALFLLLLLLRCGFCFYRMDELIPKPMRLWVYIEFRSSPLHETYPLGKRKV
ncbi:hypothetical protein LINGRAHAP2_LOCUS33374 [Linum grandiflorum]